MGTGRDFMTLMTLMNSVTEYNFYLVFIMVLAGPALLNYLIADPFRKPSRFNVIIISIIFSILSSLGLFGVIYFSHKVLIPIECDDIIPPGVMVHDATY